MQQATYPTELVLPMKEELTDHGFSELLDVPAVEAALARPGTLLIVINSVCGCSAGALRPGVLEAIRKSPHQPNHLATAFAGYDLEAVKKIREHLLPYPPSSPSVALFKDGKLITLIERHQIEGARAEEVSQALQKIFQAHCV